MSKFKKFKKIIVGLLIIIMTVPTVACGNKKASGSKTVMDKTHVYKESPLKFDINQDNVNQQMISNGRIYFLSSEYHYVETEGDGDYDVMPYDNYKYKVDEAVESVVEDDALINGAVNEDVYTTTSNAPAPVYSVINDSVDSDIQPVENQSYTTYNISSFKLDGTDKKELQFDLKDGSYINSIGADKDENIYYASSSYTSYYDADGNYVYNESYEYVKTDFSNNEKWRIKLTDIPQIAALEYFYPYNNPVITDDGEIFILSDSGVLALNSDGTFKALYSDLNGGNKIFKKNDGKIIFSKWGDYGEDFYYFDPKTGQLSDKQEMPKNASNFNTIEGYYYDVYFTSSSVLYGYNFGDAELTEIMDFIDSDLEASYVNNIMPISETEFIISYYDEESYQTIFSVMSKVPESEVVDKEVITLACYYIDYQIRKQIIQFNKTNDKYRITITDYSQYDNYENDQYTSGTTQMNKDLIAGKVPDIVITNSELPIVTYISKGMFTDLNSFLDNDAELNRSDYLENVLNAMSQNGKLYQVAPSFMVMTVAGKTSDVGTGTGWTMDDLKTLLASKPEGTKVFSEITRDNFLTYVMTLGSSQFINWETGEVNFDNEDFVKVLEMMKTLPEEINWDELYNDDSYWSTYESQYRDGATLLSYVYFSQFERYKYLQQGDFGTDINFIGFPTANSNGSAIMVDMGMAISANSRVKDGAWEFIRYFLMDDYQNNLDYQFPIKTSAYDKIIADAKSKPYWIDDDGNKVEYDNSYWIGDVEVKIDPCTDEDIDYLMTFLKSLNQVYSIDEDLMSIIEEEASAFFSGQKSAKDVAAIIQSRVKIYVSESR